MRRLLGALLLASLGTSPVLAKALAAQPAAKGAKTVAVAAAAKAGPGVAAAPSIIPSLAPSLAAASSPEKALAGEGVSLETPAAAAAAAGAADAAVDAAISSAFDAAAVLGAAGTPAAAGAAENVSYSRPGSVLFDGESLKKGGAESSPVAAAWSRGRATLVRAKDATAARLRSETVVTHLVAANALVHAANAGPWKDWTLANLGWYPERLRWHLGEGEVFTALLSVPGAVTSVFLHANMTHLAWNMALLFAFGGLVERRLGRAAAGRIFVGSALAGSLLALPFDAGIVLGASGGVLGLMTAYAYLFARNGRRSFHPPRTVLDGARVAAFVYAAWQGLVAIESFVELGAGSGTVALAAHAGGAIAGAFLARWYASRAEPVEPA